MEPDQIKSIQSWTEQRDTLLKDISTLSSQKNTLIDEVTVLGLNKADLQEQITVSKGRLIELDEQEKTRANLLSIEVADLLKQKASLENVLKILQDETLSLQEKKTLLLKDLEVLLPTYERIAFQIGALNETVNTVVKVNQENTKEFNILIFTVSNILKGLISKTEEMNTVIDEIKHNSVLNSESANNVNASVGILSKKISELK